MLSITPSPRSALLATLALCALAGCAATAPVVEAPREEPRREAIDDPSRIGYQSDVGGLPEEAMQRAFASLGKEVESCVMEGSSHLEALGGRVTISLKIDTEGKPSSVFVSESGLGDRATEKCIVEAAKVRSWPHAVGGVGIASTSFDTTPAKDRAAWDAKKVKPAIEQVRAFSAKCRRGSPGDFVVTAYVRPDGRVQTAGLSMSTAEAEDAADCIVDAVLKVKFGNPGKASKLSFAL